MSNINPYRMLGRIAQLPYSLMGRYNMRLTANVPDVRQLLYALSTKVNQSDSSLCQKAITLYSEYLNQAQALRLPQHEADRLHGEGVEEARYIFSAYPQSYGTYLFLNEDFLAEREEKLRAKKARNKRTMMIVLGAIAAVVLGVVIYNLPYFKEIRAYDRVKDAYSDGYSWELDYSVDDYIMEYPEGKHLDEVLMIMVKAKQKDDNAVYTLNAAEQYLELLPDGPNAAECRQIISDIWDAEIAKYQSRVQTPTKATEFVVSMLQYMKRENVRKVAVKITPNIQVKDFDDYSPEVKRMMEYFYSDSDPKLSTLLSVKAQLFKINKDSWGQYIIDGLNRGFNKVLTPSFIEFENVADISDVDDKLPMVNVDYTVKTQEDQYGLPDLWIYTSSYGGVTLQANKCLVFGISMEFEAAFDLPATGQKLDIKSQGNPGDSDIKAAPEDAYGIMCSRCTQVFAEDLSRQLGLPQVEE